MSEVAKQHPATMPEAFEPLAEWLSDERERVGGDGIVDLIEKLGLDPSTVVPMAQIVMAAQLKANIGAMVQAASDEDAESAEALVVSGPLTTFAMGVMVGRAVPEPAPLDPDTITIPDALPEGFGE